MDKLSTDKLLADLPNFDRWLQVDQSLAGSTFNHHHYNILKILHSMERFNKVTAQDFLIDLKRKVTPGTVETYIFTIRVYCKYLEKCGILDYNFGKDFMLPKREPAIPNILTVNEIEKILSTDLPLSYAHYPKPELAKYCFDSVLEILVKTGARLGEVLSIKIGDINWIDGVWSLRHTKTRRGRLVPIPPELLRKMSLLANGRPSDQPLFINSFSNRPLREHNVETNFNTRVKMADIKKSVTVHTLRHSFIVEMFKADISVLKIANIVGHDNIKTTQDYAKLLYEDLREAILRHPLTAKDRDPQDILNQLKDTIKKFHLQEDPRFVCKVSEIGGQYQISIMIV